MNSKTYIPLVALLLVVGTMAQGQGSFCGAVGTTGCEAVAADSSCIVGWATSCTLGRGPMNAGQPGSGLVTYGGDTNAIGPVGGLEATDAVSLGDGGWAVLTFAEPLRNGEGPDLAVFENGIVSNVTHNAFLELAFVEVSTDGERYVRFPATSLTPTDVQVGTFGEVDPTMIHNLAGKYQIGYGTPFDLEELRDSTGIDIDSIVYVRIVDVVGSVDTAYASYDAFGHMVNDPFPTPFASSGFDLTGVAVLRACPDGSNAVSAVRDVEKLTVYPNPAVDQVSIRAAAPTHAVLYDCQGRCVMRLSLVEGDNTVSLHGLPRGVYVLRCGTAAHKVEVRMR